MTTKSADEAMREAVNAAVSSYEDAPAGWSDWRLCDLVVREAIRALDAAGWQCVPKEPAGDMYRAGIEARQTVIEVWGAMLAAAPRLTGNADDA